MKESDILKQITDYLTVKGYWWSRMNSGAMFGSHNGKRWAVRFGRKGMADILMTRNNCLGELRLVWIEVKNEKGVQSEDQKKFEIETKGEGHWYILARSIDDLITAGL